MPIEFENVTVRFGPVTVLDEVALSIADGSMTALVGPSGAGKTTCLQVIGGLLSPDVGRVTGTPPMAEIRWVFQVPTALGRRTVAENVSMGIGGQHSATDIEVATAKSLVSVGLENQGAQLVSTLSGGELQRMQIARALVSRPPLVLADEPTGQLDWRSAQSVIEALRSVQLENTTMVIATHDSRIAGVCDEQLAVANGHIERTVWHGELGD